MRVILLTMLIQHTLACAPGTYVASGLCLACTPGKYSPATNSTACIACAPGSIAQTPGSTGCTRCPAGTASINSTTTCTPCSPGQFTPSPTQCTNCTICSQGSFTASACTPSTDTVCQQCKQCSQNQYISSQKCTVGTYNQPGWDNQCLACTACTNQTFLATGCDGINAPVCQACSQCDQAIRPCTPVSDTVCSNVAQCHSEFNYTWPSWLPLDTPICRQGQYVVTLSPELTCAPCPDYLVGNGLYCEQCPGFMSPYFNSLSCVCAHGTVHDDQDNCECPPGYEFGANLCVECPQDTYTPDSLVLQDDWWNQYKICRACPPGTTAIPGSTACTACIPGQYREATQTGCQNCTIAGYFARNASTASSCTACNQSCPVGYDALECPLNPGLYTCEKCPKPPANASYWSGCLYACNQGFFASNDTCQACNTSECEPGFNRSDCTAYHDSDCLTPCEDATKPLWYSQYTQGCSWACIPGYTLVTKNYVLYTINECVQQGPSSFFASLFS